MRAWHFVGDKLRNGDPVPPDGERLVWHGELVMCKSGLHACVQPFDALRYSPGPVLCMVECNGGIIHDTDKLVCSQRTIIVRMDATELLRYFARMQAVSVVHLWDAPDVVLDYLMTGDESLRGAAWDAAWAATGDAAWDAAWAATGDAACAAAGAAAGDAARAAAWAAAGDAARGAAWTATGDASRAAAWDAARDAAWTAAWDAAGDASRAAAWDAAWTAAWDAAGDAARAAAWDAAGAAARGAAWTAAGDEFNNLVYECFGVEP